MKRVIKKLVFGTSIPQEYICLGIKNFTNPLSIFLTGQHNNQVMQVTSAHLFLGYKPLVMAIIFDQSDTMSAINEVVLHFNHGDFYVNDRWNGFESDENSIGRISLKKIQIKKADNKCIVFYEGKDAWHRFISPVNQKVMAFMERRKNKPEFNIDLNNNLYEQVRIAYAVPRIISLITVFDGKLINIFPTDLHGPLNENFYAGSLRIGGKACQQVEQNKRIVISDIDASQFRESYALGKRHMKDMELPSGFRLNGGVSEKFKVPLPLGVGRYRELEITDYFDAGLHRIFIYKVVYDHIEHQVNTLSHIHRYYAQWRMNRGIETEYIWR